MGEGLVTYIFKHTLSHSDHDEVIEEGGKDACRKYACHFKKHNQQGHKIGAAVYEHRLYKIFNKSA